MTLNLALVAPGRVRSIVLLAPAATFVPMRKRLFLRFLPVLILPNRTLAGRLFKWLANGFTVNEKLLEQIIQAALYSRHQKGIFPSVYTDDELRRLQVPTLLLIGDKEVIYDPLLVMKRVRQVVPRIQAEIIPNASHFLPMQQPQLISDRIQKFIEEWNGKGSLT